MIGEGLNVSWNMTLIKSLWDENTVSKILSIYPGGTDIRCWGMEPDGSCSTEAISMAADPLGCGPHLPWKRLWKLNTPSKLKNFAWRILNNSLPTKEKLHSWDQNISPLCALCSNEIETVDHLFAHYRVTTYVWGLFPNSIPGPNHHSGWFWTKASPENQRIGITICWYIC